MPATDLECQQATLILIDVQKGLDDPWFGKRNNPDAEQNIVRLLTQWRAKLRPIIHLQHASVNPRSPLHPDRPGFQLKRGCEPLSGETQLVKNVNSAFIDTGLEQHLRDADATSVVVCGLTAEHCVSTSVRHASNLGFNVTLAADATASFDSTDHNGKYFTAEQVYDLSLATLNDEFCRIKSTSEILQQSRCYGFDNEAR